MFAVSGTVERESLSNPTDQLTGQKWWACDTTGFPTLQNSRGQAVIWGVGGMCGAGRANRNHTERQCGDLCFTQFVKLITFFFPSHTFYMLFHPSPVKYKIQHMHVAVCICDIFAFWWHSWRWRTEQMIACCNVRHYSAVYANMSAL